MMHRHGLVAGLTTLALTVGAAAQDGASDAAGDTEPPKAEQYTFDGAFEHPAGAAIVDTPPRRPEGPPNVVLIIADDLGWPYMGFLGDENVLTPNMDVLGEGGAVFEVGHSSSNHCRPTLQSLITGLYPVQYENQVSELVEQRLDADPAPEDLSQQASNAYRNEIETSMIAEFRTLPRVLGEVGYASHQSGKWWEQSYAHGGFTHGMTGRWEWEDAEGLGDNWFFTFMGGQGMEIGRNTMEPITDFIADHAEQPFFVWYGPALPHVPLNPPHRFRKYFQDRDDLSESAKLYYANIAWFDWGVGELIDSLEANGVLDNTLIVYINDNGWEQPADVEYANDRITFGNGGPRGKGSFFETAFRTPIIFYWKGKITPVRDRTTLANAIDVMPTILDYAGVAAPDGLPGYSLRPAIDGADIPDARAQMIGKMDVHRTGSDFRGAPFEAPEQDLMGAPFKGYYLRDLRWHFVWLPDTDETALYDLENDPGQLTDVSGEQEALITGFKTAITAWRREFETL